MATYTWAVLTICGFSQAAYLDHGKQEVDEQGKAIAVLKEMECKLLVEQIRGKYYLITPKFIFPKQKQFNRIPLERLAKIDKIIVPGMGLKDSHLKQLSHMKNIQCLEIYDGITSFVTDAGIKHLQRLDNLREFRFDYGSDVTDKSLKYLGKLSKLEVIIIAYSKIGDSGIKHLKNISKLRELELQSAHVSDEGLKQLIPLTYLERVDLSYNDRLTDKCLEHLQKLRKVRCVFLLGTKVSDSAVEDLRKVKPDMCILNR